MRLLNTYCPTRTLFLGFSEACLVAIAFVVAAITRLGANDATLMLGYEQGFVKILVIAGCFMICMYYFDLYNSSVLSNRREVLTRITSVLGTVCVCLAFLYYIYPPLELGRGILLIGFIFLGVFLYLWRHLFLKVNTLQQLAERVLIFGEGPLAAPLLSELRSRPELGLRVVGHIPDTATTLNGPASAECRQLELSTEAFREPDLSETVKSLRVNRIVIAMGDRRGRLPVEQLLLLKGGGVAIQDGTDVYEAITGKLPIECLRLGWLLFSPGFRISSFLLIYKRICSIIVSIIGLILSLPLFPLVVLAVKITSPGPLFYKQSRIGRYGAVFYCYKVRTMCADAEADSGPTWTGDDDPRITVVGRFLRSSRIDEIPQLWNVLKGDMNLVGPRPERPEFVRWLNQEIPHYNLRHTVRPGITGWAQIRYKYGNSVDDAREKLRYDLFYIKNLSPGLDLVIFVDTIKTILLGRGAK